MHRRGQVKGGRAKTAYHRIIGISQYIQGRIQKLNGTRTTQNAKALSLNYGLANLIRRQDGYLVRHHELNIPKVFFLRRSPIAEIDDGTHDGYATSERYKKATRR
ncbi:hypothetical protein Trydic_g19570 [Trypoxylus dichotomus]